MGSWLFAHNQTAYEAAVSMMEDKGKAAVIHPTGTGKSFIGFQLALEHPDKRVCWLSPSEYIYQTQLESLKRVLREQEAVPHNITFLTYSRLMLFTGRENERKAGEAGTAGTDRAAGAGETAGDGADGIGGRDGIEELQPDYIILDEFHRCGAVEWGKGVRGLLDRYPQARLLGLSATNVRYLDGQRDMAQELFDGNIASEMTLGSAIAEGILTAPEYVISLYSYEKELLKWERRRASIHNKITAEKCDNLLERLRRALEQAEGLEQIFEKYMRSGGRYLVFCMDKAHMEEMKENAGKWFAGVDSAPHIYTAYYSDSLTGKAFRAFQEDDSGHLKLLYCIDMLNEGVHVADVDGVILLRPTISPILYLQQIGRCLSSGSDKRPVIFDLVNNVDSLRCIDYLQAELKEAYVAMPCTARERQGFDGSFQVQDELKDCRDLFRQLQENLGASWEVYFQAAADYCREFGNLKVPRTYVTKDGLSLGSWIQIQRRVYAGKKCGALSREQIQRLEDIHMIWDVRNENWESGYAELYCYYQEHGNADVNTRYVTASGFHLGKWIRSLRERVKKNGKDRVLNPRQQEQLERLGFKWDKSGPGWEDYYQSARQYYLKYGNLKIPKSYVTADNLPLGSWIRIQRRVYAGKRPGSLSGEQIARLEAIGMIWSVRGSKQL